jgi:hypothetical protein
VGIVETLGALIGLSGVVAFLVGAISVAWPLRMIGLERRTDGILVVVASIFMLIVGGQLTKSSPSRTDAHAAISQEPAARDHYVSRSEALQNIAVRGFRWEKSGFGAVMMATFVIYNNNNFPIKDVEVTCVHAANSGTKIDSNTRTIYEIVRAKGYFSVVDMNMGFIHSKATSSNCKATDFARM